MSGVSGHPYGNLIWEKAFFSKKERISSKSGHRNFTKMLEIFIGKGNIVLHLRSLVVFVYGQKKNYL